MKNFYRLFALILILAIQNSAKADNNSLQFTAPFYINIPNSTATSPLYFTSDTFTLEAWIRPSSFPATTNNFEYTIIGTDDTTVAGGGFAFRTGGSRKLSFYFSSGSVRQEIVTTNPVLIANQWQHVAVSKEGGDVTLFLDGKIVATASLSGNTVITPSSKTLKIGVNGNAVRRFSGRMDELKIWSSARSLSQVTSDGTEICGTFPSDLLAYYPMNDTGLAATANPIVCVNNALLNGVTNSYIIIHFPPGALLVPAGTTELYVDSAHAGATGCGAQAGYSWATAFGDLNTAIEAAHLNHQIEKIHVAKGTYYPHLAPFEMLATGVSRQPLSSWKRSDMTFHLRPGLELYGGYPNGGGVARPAQYRTILDGSRAFGSVGDTVYNVVYVDTSYFWPKIKDTTKLVGFTVRNGIARQGPGLNFGNGSGGGIFIQGGLCQIKDCYIVNNQCYFSGGGIMCNGITEVTNDTIVNNLEGIASAGTTEIHDCYIFRNSSYGISLFGGGLKTVRNNVITENEKCGITQLETPSLIIKNWVHHNGEQGIFVYQGYAHIEDNIVTDHRVKRVGNYNCGGGIYLYGGSQTVLNNTIMRDTAETGGGIYMFNGTNYVQGNHIEANVATSYGGGLWCKWGDNWFIDNIVAKNSAFVSGGMYVEGDGITTGNFVVENTATDLAGGVFITGDFKLINNVIARNKCARGAAVLSVGMHLWGNEIANNTFFANEVIGNPVYDGDAGGLIAQSHSNIYNNIFWKNKYRGSDTIPGSDYINATDTAGITVSNNAMQNPASSYVGGSQRFELGTHAANNLFAFDPQFADTINLAGPDGQYGTADDGLQLLLGSPLMDTGNTAFIAGLAPLDIKKAPRVYGRNVDMGAYELGCAIGNSMSSQQRTACRGTQLLLRVNTTALPPFINWYADSITQTILDTGYYFLTPKLSATDTFWVAATGCADSARIPIRVFVPAAPTITLSGDTLHATPGAKAYQWLMCNPFQPIPGANDSTFIPSLNGSYAVEVNQDGCLDTTACVTISGVSVGGVRFNDPILVKPNPASGLVEISAPSDLRHTELLVVDMLGAVRYRSQIEPGKTLKIDISAYPIGVYSIAVTDGSRSYHAKLIKE